VAAALAEVLEPDDVPVVRPVEAVEAPVDRVDEPDVVPVAEAEPVTSGQLRVCFLMQTTSMTY
jgi:hypothetical protein